MPDLGVGSDVVLDPPALGTVLLDPPAVPTVQPPAFTDALAPVEFDAPDAGFLIEPPALASLLVVPVEGPQGEQGPQGVVDEAAVGPVVDQYLTDHPPTFPNHAERAYTSATATWDWQHNLGFTPAVTVMTADRQVIVGTVTVNGPSRTTVQFFVPLAGVMALS